MVYRQSMLLTPEDFGVIFKKLESIVGNIGKPGGSLIRDGEKMVYRYAPFHRFEMSFTPAIVEPLVFFNSTGSGASLLIIRTSGFSSNWKRKHQAYGGTRPRESRSCANTL